MTKPRNLVSISDEEREERSKLWTGPYSAMIDMVYNDEFYMPKRFLEIQDEIKELEIRSDDLFLISYPKAGSTWSQEMVWQLKEKINFEGGKEMVHKRIPFLEIECLVQRGPNSPDKSVETVRNMSGPRIIKTHLLSPYLPKDLLNKGKVIYIMRNPKDVCVSFYHHEMLLKNHEFSGTFDEFAELFLEGKVAYGSYWEHLKFGLEIRKLQNVLFICYENMKKDLVKEMKRVIEFMNWEELSHDQLETLNQHLSFNSCQKNPALNFEPDKDNDCKKDKRQFIRKGIVGDWKEYFTPELSRRFDSKTEACIKLEDFKIQYEL